MDTCPVSKSGLCLKSVSAAITDHPACEQECELLDTIPKVESNA